MKPPLLDALEKQIGAGRARFHMPGHKGILPPPLCEAPAYDFTELPLTGSLFEGIGPMAETERAFSAFYNSGASLLSAGGSTLCIQAMLALGASPGGKIAAGRNCHAAAVNAMALLGLEPVWLYPDEPSGTALPGRVSPALVGRALRENPDLQAVYLTSPDYFGVLCDVEAIAEICHRRRVPLLVDNAHGAHLAFFGLHPMALGADLCCDSLHKTLPALTGAALLHLRDGARAEEARARMALFGSTSPSYLILLSVDLLAARPAGARAPKPRAGEAHLGGGQVRSRRPGSGLARLSGRHAGRRDRPGGGRRDRGGIRLLAADRPAARAGAGPLPDSIADRRASPAPKGRRNIGF